MVVFSVTLIWAHAALVYRAYIEETGTFPMDHDYSQVVVVVTSMRSGRFRELIFDVEMMGQLLVYIIVP